MDSINKKYAEIKKEHKKMEKDIKSFQNATALQLKTFSEGMTASLNKLGDAYNTMSKGVDERFKVLERKPCMEIESILTEGELTHFRELIK